MQKKILEIEDIKQLIPQRYPFLMIDRVIEACPEKVVAIKNVSMTEHFFEGHFPDLKVMPGALMIEAMAQAGIVLYKQKYQNANLLYLVSVKSRFFNPAYPGDQLRIEVLPLKMFSKMGLFKAEITVADKRIAQAEIAFGSQDAKAA